VEVIFKIYSSGVKTNRDAWVYNFNRNALAENMKGMIDTYNEQVLKWERRADRAANVDNFVVYDDRKISWSGDLKLKLKNGKTTNFSQEKVRTSLYRPFTKSNLYFDRVMNNSVYVFPSIYSTPETETENRVICVAGIGDRKGFGCLTTNKIPSVDLAFEKIQCFPFYTYDGTGTTAGTTSPIGR
jgi:predicted helicase